MGTPHQHIDLGSLCTVDARIRVQTVLNSTVVAELKCVFVGTISRIFSPIWERGPLDVPLIESTEMAITSQTIVDGQHLSNRDITNKG
jgi:hypothetical protein